MPSLSRIMNNPNAPPTVGMMPIIKKNFCQSETVALLFVSESNPPNTIASATRGIIASIVSTFALFAVFVTSVIHVLKAASLLIEPMTDIMQSITTTRITTGKTFSLVGCIGTSENAAIVNPQIT